MSANASPEKSYVFERPPWNRPWTWTLLAIIVLVADFLTGPFIAFPFFFVIPVLLMAWHCRVTTALAAATLLSFARLGFQWDWGMLGGLTTAFINTAIRMAVLGLLAVLTNRVAAQTRDMRQRVRLLEGILPICGFCKDIRDDSGEWTKLETYISHRSEAQFTHGVCEKCARLHYGDFFAQTRAARAIPAIPDP